jgi:pimeloyl-ACP methyl ester carboxylesterase
MTRTNLISINNLQLEYYVFGDGEEVVICMHGHGRTASDFQFLEAANRKIISIHLFHHGNSIFPESRIENNPLRTEEFVDLFELIVKEEAITKFHLLAFSQGGRFALCLLPFIAKNLLSFTLIAPDGMDNHSFYNWSSRQKWARALMKSFESNPNRLISLSKIAYKLRLMRPKVRDFVHEFSANKKLITQASATWRTFRLLLPNNKAISKAIKINKIPFLIIMGEYDQVIRPKQAYQFAENIGIPDCVIEINNGHNFFKKSSINKFVGLLPFINNN